MNEYKQLSVSVIIPTYNESATIRGTVEHLRPWNNILEIIVADGGSSDGTARLVGPEVKLPLRPGITPISRLPAR